MMYNRKFLNDISAACMDILVDKPGFPDFSFVLYRDGWFTHHIVVERRTAIIAGQSARGARRLNYAGLSPRPFDLNYADKAFEAIETANEREKWGLKTDTIAVIPFDNRGAEILLLGEIESNEPSLKTLRCTGQQGGMIKIYSPPQDVLDRYAKGAKAYSN